MYFEIQINPFISISIALMSIAIVAIVASYALHISREDLVKRFVYGMHIEDKKLFLPAVATIDIGDVYIEGYWVSNGKSSSYHSKVEVANAQQVEASVLDLDTICNSSFYVYVDRGNNVLAIAPGFIIKSGEYRDIVVLCLDKSKIPTKEIELRASKGSELALARVKLGPTGYETSVKWVVEAPADKRLVYDEEKGVYRFVEEYKERPRARGARVEICFKKPRSGSLCREVAVARAPGEEAKGTKSFNIITTIVVFHRKLLQDAYRLFSSAIESQGQEIVAGYREGFVYAKSVLDIPLARDSIAEQPI
ncbi:MAG: hypothetical protein QW747_08480 [Ignisphaera sp.]